MKADGKGWLFAPNGLVDGPLPTHYEPVESPVPNPLYHAAVESGAQVLEASTAMCSPLPATRASRTS